MFYGLNKFVKNLLPKRLFYRGLLIVAVPILVLQVTITLVNEPIVEAGELGIKTICSGNGSLLEVAPINSLFIPDWLPVKVAASRINCYLEDETIDIKPLKDFNNQNYSKLTRALFK